MRFDTDDGHDYSCHVLAAATPLAGCVVAGLRFRTDSALLLQVDVSDLLDLLSDYGRVC